MTPRQLRTIGLAALLATAAASCGGGDDSPAAPSPGGGTGTVAATITITASGVSPSSVTVPVGSRVTFVNNDSRSHTPASDPHPTHGSCPPLDQVGTIQPGQSRTSGNLNTAGTCTYHDHDLPDTAGLRGTVRVQ